MHRQHTQNKGTVCSPRAAASFCELADAGAYLPALLWQTADSVIILSCCGVEEPVLSAGSFGRLSIQLELTPCEEAWALLKNCAE